MLLSVCEFYGFRSKTNALLWSYLSDRYQRILINNNSSNTTTFSEWGKIKHGIHQGSIHGPLFFLIYINDLPNIIADPSKLILFADDTSIIIINLSPSKFKDSNNIIFYNLCLKSHQISVKISCDNNLIKETKNTEFFGLDIDSSGNTMKKFISFL
jgi:hypothetical protein